MRVFNVRGEVLGVVLEGRERGGFGHPQVKVRRAGVNLGKEGAGGGRVEEVEIGGGAWRGRSVVGVIKRGLVLGGAGEVDHRVGGSGGHGVARGGGGERGGRRAGHGGMLRARLVNEVGNMGSICLKVI